MKMVRFEKWFINSERHNEQVVNRADILLQFVDTKENQNYLEVGCGNGRVCRHVAEKYPWNVTGVDIDPEQIRLAQENSKNLTNINFQQADTTKLPFPDDEFDIVLSFCTTHHISNWLDALGEMRRILKPEGYFIYYDFVYKRLFAKLGRSFKHSFGITNMPELYSFVQKSDLSRVHTSIKNSLIWYNYEAVYQSA